MRGKCSKRFFDNFSVLAKLVKLWLLVMPFVICNGPAIFFVKNFEKFHPFFSKSKNNNFGDKNVDFCCLNFLFDFFSKFLTKNIAGPLHNPKSIIQSPILDIFWPTWTKQWKLSKKALGTFFSRLQALTNCIVSEKSNERFPRKSVALHF